MGPPMARTTEAALQRELFSFRAGRLTSPRLAEVVGRGSFTLDPETIAAAALGLAPLEQSRTVYREVQSVGRNVGGDLSPVDVERPRSPAAAVATVRSALEQTVERSLAGAGCVAVLTSGGLDSAAVLALTVAWARQHGRRAFAVTLDYESPGDDRPHMAALEEHLDCEVVRVAPEQAKQRLALIHGVDAAPFTWPSAPLEVELLATARDHGADRVLTGEGGDELFYGDPRSLSRYLRRGAVLRAIQAARRLEGVERTRFAELSWLFGPPLRRLQPKRFRLARARRAFALRPQPWAGPLARSFLAERARRDLTLRLAAPRAPRTPAEDDRLARMRHQEIVAAGVEVRDPLLDRTLNAAVAAVPAEWMLLGDAQRGLFREALRGLVPESLRRRADKGWFEPAIARFSSAACGGLEGLRDLSTCRELASLGIVEPAPFASSFELLVRHPQPQTAIGWLPVWLVLAAEAFLRAHRLGAWKR